MSSSDNRRASIRIGVGAGTADDRIYPAIQLAEHGELDYLVFECLAERTIARENLTPQQGSDRGYTPRLLERMEAVLPACLRRTACASSPTWAPPIRAAARRAIVALAQEWALGDIACAVVTGDDVAISSAPCPSCR